MGWWGIPTVPEGILPVRRLWIEGGLGGGDIGRIVDC